jgi:glycine cleavage system T protein (aminomethyltransferase)
MTEGEPAEELKRTPLEPRHRDLGAKLGPFAGWLMPIEYQGVLAEHRAVRRAAGLFDLTHLGKVEVTGPGALGMLQRVLTNDLARIGPGQAQYELVLNDRGGVVEDLIAYRLDDDRFLLAPNAANVARIVRILRDEEEAADGRARVVERRDRCLLAVQGPSSVDVVSALFPEASELAFMGCAEARYAGERTLVARSGYTGEVGFELFAPPDVADALWAELHERVRDTGGGPCGLAARDVLRLEMGYALYGQDLSEDRTPLEAGLGWAVAVDKGGFRGRDALVRQREDGLPSRLRGLRMAERRHIPRAGYGVFLGDTPVGEVTSGTFSPELGTGIALAYVRPADAVGVGDEVEVDVRGRRGTATVVAPPFVERSPR